MSHASSTTPSTHTIASLIELDPGAIADYMLDIHHLEIATHPFEGVKLSERLPTHRALDFDWACLRARKLAAANGVISSVTVNRFEVHEFAPDGGYQVRSVLVRAFEKQSA